MDRRTQLLITVSILFLTAPARAQDMGGGVLGLAVVGVQGRGRRWPAEVAAILFTAFTGLLVYSTALGIIIHADANFSWVPVH